MGFRTQVTVSAEVGFNNSLDDLIFERDLEETTDTMDHAWADGGTLAAGETNRQVTLGSVTQVRWLHLEAEGEISVYFGGTAATAGRITGAGGTYPTGFLGGETFSFLIDATTVAGTFLVGDQSLAQVVARVNAAAALAGLPTPVASSYLGQLRLTSPTTGLTSLVTINAGTANVLLGLTPGATNSGTAPQPATSPYILRRMADPSGSAAPTLKAYLIATLCATAIYLTNLDPDNAVNYKVCVVGDLTE